MESQKIGERQSNRENINDSLGLTVLQTQLAVFPDSRNKQVILDP